MNRPLDFSGIDEGTYIHQYDEFCDKENQHENIFDGNASKNGNAGNQSNAGASGTNEGTKPLGLSSNSKKISKSSAQKPKFSILQPAQEAQKNGDNLAYASQPLANISNTFNSKKVFLKEFRKNKLENGMSHIPKLVKQQSLLISQFQNDPNGAVKRNRIH